MEIFPAIDISNNSVVRLTQGDFNRSETYPITPLEAAQTFSASGAKNLHIVDLDGAKNGAVAHYHVIEEIVRQTTLFVEIGGGIRNESAIESYLSLGVGHVILGTAAVNNSLFLFDMFHKYGERIAIGVDAKKGFVAVNGWQKLTILDSLSFCRRLKEMGAKTIIYTDIARDGVMHGANIEIYRELVGMGGVRIVASGGISTLDDVKALKETGADAAIVGKALYTGKLNLKDILSTAKEEF